MSSSPPREGRALDRHFLSGLAWTGFVKWGSQALSWISTVVVARILSPGDFGIIGMTATYMALVTVLSEFGLGFAVINRRVVSSLQLAQLQTTCVFLGIAGLLVSFVMATPLALFFRVPELTWVMMAMGTSFLVSSFRTVPGALLQRDLEFRTLAWIEGLQAVVQAVIVVALAILGFRYWSLVLGMVLGAGAAAIAASAVRPCGFAWPKRSIIGDALGYGRQILGGQLAWYVVSSADLLVVGRLLGASATGVYTMAFTIASTPVEKITALVGRVAFPLFSHVRNDLPAMRRYFLLLTEGLALAGMPLAIGLALTADRFVPVVLGQKWLDAVVPLAILALLATIRSFTPMITHVLNAVGRQRFAMYNGFLMAGVGPIAFVVGAKLWGLPGVAVGWLAVMAVSLPFVTWATLSGIQLPFRTYLGALGPAASACAIMTAAVLAARFGLAGAGLSLTAAFLTEVAAGAIAYLGAVFLFHRHRIESIRSVLRREPGPAEPGRGGAEPAA
ncbi:MAG TPA: lipopolysaccharide biosynthesis protein [Candidatus Eisenbacteria bacterium]|nr:lipopolysaccharide biosynthesis protein [Candidatus Eisenbacteria bacterium]